MTGHRTVSCGVFRRGRDTYKRDTQRLRSVAVRRDGYRWDRRDKLWGSKMRSEREPRQPRARNARRKVDPRGRRPRNPAGSKTIVNGNAAPAAAAVLRRVRVEIRTVGSSATEASDGGVGTRGGKSGGVAPESTAKTGVKAASVAGRSKWLAAEADIIGTDGSRNTGDESPGGSRKVVSPHTWPACAKIAKISGGKGEPTQDGAIGLGHQPTQANAGDRCGGGEQAASPDEVYGLIVYRGEAARNAAVVFSRRLWQPREEVSITICASLSLLWFVVKRGEVLEPPLDSRVVVSNFSDFFQNLVNRENARLRTPKVASKALDRPYDAACFQIERRPMSFRVEGSAAYIGNGPHGAGGLFLL